MLASSIGVIGGADGPTAIYLTGKTPLGVIMIIAVCAVALFTLVVTMFVKRK